MAIPGLSKIKECSPNTIPANHLTSLLDEVDQLIESFESRFLSPENVATIAQELMDQLYNMRENDLPLAREGLCSLLRLNIEKVQSKIIPCLKSLLQLSPYLAYDVEYQQSKQLVSLEQQLSTIIRLQCESKSSPLLLPLIDLYTDIIERLWLLPHLIKDRSAYATIVEENGPLILNCADPWLKTLSKDNISNHPDLEVALKNLQKIMQRVFSCPLALAKKILQLRPYLTSVLISLSVGEIYQEIEEIHRAVNHYQESSSLLTKLKAKVKNLADQKTLKELELIVLNHLGNTHHSLGEYRKAISFHEKRLQIAQELSDREGEGRAYGNLGIAYWSLGEYRKAIEFHEKHLQIAQERDDRGGEGSAYGNLGIAYQFLGEYRKAIEFHEKSLQIAQERGDRGGKGKAYGNLGIAYRSLGEYRKAIEFYEKRLQIAQELSDRGGEERAYGNLGIAYWSLGEYRKAIEFHEKDLQIAKELGDRREEGGAYGNLGGAYQFLGEYPKAIEFYEKHLQIAQKLGDRRGEERAYGNLGNAYHSVGEYRKAIRFHENQLQIAQELSDREGEGKTYGNLGIVYQSLGEYRKAIGFHEKHLQIAQNLGDREGKAEAFNNLGLVYEKLNDLLQAEKNLRQGIAIFSTLQHELGDHHQWKIAIFEEQARAYIGLERVLLKQNKIPEALEITDARRSRALVSALSKRHPSVGNQLSLTSPQIQAFADRLNTTFVVYSLAEKKIKSWIISPQKKMVFQLLTLPDDMQEAVELLASFPFDRQTRGQAIPKASEIPFFKQMKVHFRDDSEDEEEMEILQEALEEFNQKLLDWHEKLIAPLEPYLPKDPQQTVTIIPDDFLSQIPFAAFQDPTGQYLIEKHPISIVPSITTLHLLNQLPRESTQTSLVIGDPATGNPKDELKLGKQEAKSVAHLLKAPPGQLLMQKEAQVNPTLQKITHAQWVHFACHGLPGKKTDPHSVFEGLLKLTPDEQHPEGHLYAQEIAQLALRAEQVFMSACFSGTGKLRREGSIGHVWSFLAAGALSTVATYWRLPESEMTIQMVETFYRHVLGNEGTEKLNKAQALQKAMKMAIQQQRAQQKEDVRQWAAFYLSGLS